MYELISTFIGMVFGACFVLLSAVPVITQLEKLGRYWLYTVTEKDHDGVTQVTKWLHLFWYRNKFPDKYGDRLYAQVLLTIIPVLGCIFTFVCVVAEKYSFFDAAILVWYIWPSILGKFLAIPLLLVILFYTSHILSKFIYKLSKRIKKLEETGK